MVNRIFTTIIAPFKLRYVLVSFCLHQNVCITLLGMACLGFYYISTRRKVALICVWWHKCHSVFCTQLFLLSKCQNMFFFRKNWFPLPLSLTKHTAVMFLWGMRGSTLICVWTFFYISDPCHKFNFTLQIFKSNEGHYKDLAKAYANIHDHHFLCLGIGGYKT